MSIETQALIRLCKALPEEKRVEVADFARFLLDRQGDDRWERTITDSRRWPRLQAFIEASRAEGGEEPLDPDRMCPGPPLTAARSAVE